MDTKHFKIQIPQEITCDKKIEKYSEVTKIILQLTAQCDVLLQQSVIKVGYCGEIFKSVILTHQLSVCRTALPFAFPAMSVLINDGQGAILVADYFKTSLPLRFVENNFDSSGWVALVNDETQLKKGDVLHCELFYSEYKADDLFTLIGKCADIVFKYLPYWKKEFADFGGQNVSSYKEASLGLVSNLMDKRAVVRDGTGTFNPYAYHEIGAYSESFACMDVAKGFYRFAVSNRLDGPLDYIRKELYRLCDTDAKHPWIADCHNTKGFFHFAWGAIPQDSGVDANISREDLFSDYCGHEEGANLLSTFKYFDRVNLLGEMAIVENDSVIKEAFLKVLPFTESLRNEDFTQPVTYDLDSHLPATGNSDGGSAGGEALYALIQFNAYLLTKQQYHLDFALNSLNMANKLDFDRMYSMRCAPKPIAIGALVRANVFAYEITGKQEYLDCAKKVYKGIFAFYYINPHPYSFFSAMGFGYACAQERWEAFREMEETLWLTLPLLKYCNDLSIFRLYALNRQNAISALPINGNPYGNLQRDYESFGGEFVPFEFSTGHIGDNPGLCGGSQSDRRQIKEIYGSGELFLAEMMYENYCRSHNAAVTVININCCVNLPQSNFEFKVFNCCESNQSAVLDFNLPNGVYKITLNGQKRLVLSEILTKGVKFDFSSGLSTLTVTRQQAEISVCKETTQIQPKVERSLDELKLTWQGCCDFYVVTDKTDLSVNVYKVDCTSIKMLTDSELRHTITVEGVCENKVVVYRQVEVSALKKEIEYEFDFESLSDLSYQGLDCISDGHSLMFYRHGLADNCAEIVFNIGKVNKGSVLELQIGAINNGTVYSVKTLCNDVERTIAQNVENAEYFAITLETDGKMQLIIAVDTTAGLGLSVLRLNVSKVYSTEKSVVLNLQKTDGGVKAVLDDYRYAVVAVGDMCQSDKFRILVDGNVSFGNIEKKFLNKVDRCNRGVFKVPLPIGAKKLEVLTDHPSNNFVKAIRLTQSAAYPIFTQYFDEEDVRKFYDN